jgi:hypothetical protein
MVKFDFGENYLNLIFSLLSTMKYIFIIFEV